MVNIISSQRYCDEQIVEEKLRAEDFTVTVSPRFEVEGQEYQVILDGHHSYHAALLAGVTPEFEVATVEQNCNVGLLEGDDPDIFLQAVYVDSDYYHFESGKYVVWA